MDRKYGKGKGRRKGKLFALRKVIAVEKGQNHPYGGKAHTVNHIKVIADDMKLFHMKKSPLLLRKDDFFLNEYRSSHRARYLFFY